MPERPPPEEQGKGPSSVDFVIVGAQRGGSTQLSASLADHPEVFLSPDEVPYFEDPFYLRSSPSALAELFAPARPGQRLGIHCPSYLGRPEAAGRIRASAPSARILSVLRDPVARSLSAYFWYMQFGMLPLQPPEVGVRRLLDGWADPAYPQAWEILDWSLYGRHLAPYLELFGPEQVLVLLSEELDGARTLSRLHTFLGLDPRPPPGAHQRTRNEGVYDLRRLRVLRARRRFAWSWAETSTYSYQPRRLRRPLRFLPNAAIVGLDRLVLSRLFGNEVATLPRALEDRLRDHFTDDVRMLEDLVDRDLSTWRSGRE